MLTSACWGRLEPSPTRCKQVNSGQRDSRRGSKGETRSLGKNGVYGHRVGLRAAPGRVFRLPDQRCNPGVSADDPPVHHTQRPGQLPRPARMATDVGGSGGDRGAGGVALALGPGARSCRRDAIPRVRPGFPYAPGRSPRPGKPGSELLRAWYPDRPEPRKLLEARARGTHREHRIDGCRSWADRGDRDLAGSGRIHLHSANSRP